MSSLPPFPTHQFSNGNVALIVNSSGGTCYAPTGEARLKWSSAPRPLAPPAVASSNGHGEAGEDGAGGGRSPSFTAASASSPSNAQSTPPPPPPFVDLALGDYGIRYCPPSKRLEVYFGCEGQRYVFNCGRNRPGCTWDESTGSSGDPSSASGPKPSFLSQLAASSRPAPAAGRRSGMTSMAATGGMSTPSGAGDDSLTEWAQVPQKRI